MASNKLKRCVKCNELSTVVKTKKHLTEIESTDLYLQCGNGHYSRVNFIKGEKGSVKIELSENEFNRFLDDKIVFYGKEYMDAILKEEGLVLS